MRGASRRRIWGRRVRGRVSLPNQRPLTWICTVQVDAVIALCTVHTMQNARSQVAVTVV